MPFVSRLLALVSLSSLLGVCGCDQPEPLRDEPRTIPHVPESAQPAIEAARERATTAAQLPSEAEADPEALERAALDQLSMAADLPAPEGRVHLLAPSHVSGRFNAESLRGVMEPKLAELEACYTNALREDRHAQGRLVVVWTLEAGSVSDIAFQSGMPNEAVRTCLSEWLRGLSLRRGARAVITQPFLFHHEF